jgi:hypothetical protein
MVKLHNSCRNTALRYRGRRLIRWLVLCFLMGLSLCLAAQPVFGRNQGRNRGIRIGIIGDQTYSSDIQAAYGVLQRGVSVLSARNLDLVLHTGDLVESSDSPEQVTALFNQATGILDRLPVPWYISPGDHDVAPPGGFVQDSPDHSREQLFQKLYGQRVPAFAVHPWYSFDLKGYHFISLYSFEALRADSRWGNIFLSRVFDDQFAFLKSDLAAHAHARAIIVWMHQPLFYHISGWYRVHELLRQYPVAAVIAGHAHYHQDMGVWDGIHYFMVGATGGVKKDGNRQAGNVDHVSLLTVTGPHSANVELLALDDKPLNISPRFDMDRLEALDSQLFFFYDFAKINPVFNKNGQLVNDCASAKVASIQINEIGNPIDVPVDVRIELTTPGVSLSNAAFAANVCEHVISGTECALKRNAHTASSNYSQVNIQTAGDPLWKSELTGSAAPGTALNFHIRTMFQGVVGELFVQTAVSTTVGSCP